MKTPKIVISTIELNQAIVASGKRLMTGHARRKLLAKLRAEKMSVQAQRFQQ